MKLIHGENASVTIAGSDLKLIQDGEIELTIERDVLEKKIRGKGVVAKIPSKTINLSGSVKGLIENSVWEDVVKPFLGLPSDQNSIDKTTDVDNITPIDELAITFDWADGGNKIKLTGVVPKSIKVSAPEDDVVSVEMEFEANGIETA